MRPSIILSFFLAIGSLAAWAQRPAPKDRVGCAESKIVSRMPGCVISICESKDYAAADMPRKRGEKNMVEGQLERTVYRCPADKSPLELGRNTEAALKNAGYQIHYTFVYGSGGRFYMTAQKGAYWVNLYVVSDAYDLTVVKQKEIDRKSTRLNSSHIQKSRMPSSA